MSNLFENKPNSVIVDNTCGHQVTREQGTNCLSLLYYNARSVLSKFDELHATVSFETWLSSDNELHIPGYQLLRLDRDSHGGVY